MSTHLSLTLPVAFKKKKVSSSTVGVSVSVCMFLEWPCFCVGWGRNDLVCMWVWKKNPPWILGGDG